MPYSVMERDTGTLHIGDLCVHNPSLLSSNLARRQHHFTPVLLAQITSFKYLRIRVSMVQASATQRDEMLRESQLQRQQKSVLYFFLPCLFPSSVFQANLTVCGFFSDRDGQSWQPELNWDSIGQIERCWLVRGGWLADFQTGWLADWLTTQKDNLSLARKLKSV